MSSYPSRVADHPVILTSLPQNNIVLRGRGGNRKTKQNLQMCSKTFSRHCLDFISIAASYRNRNSIHPRFFDGPDFICDHQKAVLFADDAIIGNQIYFK